MKPFLLERDPLLASRVMSLVSAPYYAQLGRIRSLKEAVMRLGLKTINDVVLEAALHLRVFRAKDYVPLMTAVREHSIQVAHASRLISSHTSIAADYAFLCGLLHDVGAAAILIAMTEHHRLRPPDDGTLQYVLRDAHEAASSTLAQAWKLPQEIQHVVGAHHKGTVGGVPHPLCAAVLLADAAVLTHDDRRLLKYDRNSPAHVAKARGILGISDKLADKLDREIGVMVKSLAVSLKASGAP